MTIHIDPRQLQILSDHELVALTNDLIRAEATRLKVPQSNIDTNVRDKAPDGGIDCIARGIDVPSGVDASDWLPVGNSAWQYKSGKCPSANELKETEFTKPGVKQAFDRGDTYCFVTSYPLSSPKKEGIKKVIRDLQRKRKRHIVEPRVYDGNDLAVWAEDHLSIAAIHFRIALNDWQLYRQWSAPTRFQNTFVADDQRNHLISAIQYAVSRGEKLVRIVGRAGMGKTRLVMEAIRSPDLQQHVLYLEDAEKLSYDFFDYLQRHPKGFEVLVVDESPPLVMDRLRNIAETLPHGYTIVAIGPTETETSASDIYLLGGLDRDQLAEVIGQFAPQLSADARKAIAGRCGGSPKLVQVIGEAIAKSPPDTIKTWQQIEQNLDVAQFLNTRLFPVNRGSPESISIVMRGISLFTRLGWYSEHANQGKYV